LVNKHFIFSFALILSAFLSLGQEEKIGVTEKDSLQTDLKGKGISIDDLALKKGRFNPLAPAKAGFYSAVIPGLGQIYNKRYWKVPIVWAAIGTGALAYVNFDNRYNRLRTAFKRRQAGFTDDEFFDLAPFQEIPPTEPEFSTDALEDAQERFQRDRDLALLVTIVLYALNIVDANVDAHLKQFNVNNNLALDITPFINQNPVSANIDFGMTFTIKF